MTGVDCSFALTTTLPGYSTEIYWESIPCTKQERQIARWRFAFLSCLHQSFQWSVPIVVVIIIAVVVIIVAVVFTVLPGTGALDYIVTPLNGGQRPINIPVGHR